MTTYAFVGSSGTGKSHHSMQVARELGIDYMIDDGLFISGGHILAGKSAKKEQTKIASVKRALFTAGSHVSEVKDAIAASGAERILLLGTSDKMVNRIRERLDLPEFKHTVRIEEVSSPEEIAAARKIRIEQGKHVIPVPTFEVRKHFSGYLLDPLILLFGGKDKQIRQEKTVMRPTYSYLGDYSISDRAVSDICGFSVRGIDIIHKIHHVKVTPLSYGNVNISMDVSLKYPSIIHKEGANIAKTVKRSVELYASLSVQRITVNVIGLKL